LEVSHINNYALLRLVHSLIQAFTERTFHHVDQECNLVGVACSSPPQQLHNIHALASYLSLLFRVHASTCVLLAHVLADCENGLATNIRIGNTQSWCFSAELLQECKRIQDTITPYSLNISSVLQAAIIADPESVALGAVRTGDALTNVTQVFVAAVKRRGDLSTANIRCASYEATQEDFSGASVLTAGWQAAVAVLTLTVMYIVC
jgi:hypothetical protein